MGRLKRCTVAPSPHIHRSLLLALALLLPSALAYENFTVGDDTGWTLPTKNGVNYNKWATGKNFSLGDYLLFNYPDTQNEYNVIRTYNKSVYAACSFEDANDNDYEVWGEAGHSTDSAIPLVEVGMNYFFCSTNDSYNCDNGMKFAANVSHGEGLPPSLAIPPPAPVDETAPDTSSPDTSSGSPATGTPGSPSTDTPDTSTPDDDDSYLTDNHGFRLHVESRITLLLPLMILAGVL